MFAGKCPLFSEKCPLFIGISGSYLRKCPLFFPNPSLVGFHPSFSRHGITRASSLLLIWLNENVRYPLLTHFCSTKPNLPMHQWLLRIFWRSHCKKDRTNGGNIIPNRSLERYNATRSGANDLLETIFLASLNGFGAPNQRSAHAWRHLENARQTNATQCLRANWSCRDVHHHRQWISNP